MEDDRPLTAKEKRQEQIKRWANSATDLECATYTNPKLRVKFDDGAVFLAACSSGDLDEVKNLLKRGADINFANVDGLTALHQACIDGNLEVVQFLVENGSEIDHEDNEGWTPLHATASCGFMDIAKYLVEKGANVGAVNSEAELPIDIAEEDEMIEYLQSEIDRQGIDVQEARDIERNVMLEDANHLLNSRQNGEPVEIYRHQKSGATALHITAAKGYNDVLKILIKAGIDVNVQDNDGWTPLHAASHWSQEESAKILADKNADFTIRSKLGQTPYDVADEDMLEYLNELEAEQKRNQPSIKESPVIEPPPVTSTNKSDSMKKKNRDRDRDRDRLINDHLQELKKIEDEMYSSSEEENVIAHTKIPSKQDDDEGLTMSSKRSEENEDSGLKRRSGNRPSSLHISSTQEQPQHRFLDKSNSDGGGLGKPVAATQPVQSVTRNNKENGPKGLGTPGYSSREKTDSPSSWRSGLRKTGSFDEKNRPTISNSQSENTRTARVAPLLDARRTRNEAESNDTTTNDVSGLQKSSSYGRRKYGTDAFASTTPSNNDSSVFKRSVSYKKAVGRTESLDNNDDVHEGLAKRLSPFSNVLEVSNETAQQTDETAAIKTADRRRSHLQPVRDEEAEAQRRARSRRERQSRRSTQGVTLDVVEEAMRTINKMRQPQSSADKSAADSVGDTTKVEPSSNLYRRPDESQSASSSANLSNVTSTPVTDLPSGYIPSDQRVKSSGGDKAASVIPSINFEPAQDENDDDKDSKPAEDESSAQTAPRSTALQRRRNRKERRSTGLPDLKPSSSTTENEVVDDAMEARDDLDSTKAERLRDTAAKYDTSSLSDRQSRQRPGLRGSDSDIPSRLNQYTEGISSPSSRNRNSEKNYKKLYEEKQLENEQLRKELSKAERKLDIEKKERLEMENKLYEELKKSESPEELRVVNGQLKAENTALLRIVEKLGGSMPNRKLNDITKNMEQGDVTDSQASSYEKKIKSESSPELRNLDILDTGHEKLGSSDERTVLGNSSQSSSSSSISALTGSDVRRSSLHETNTSKDNSYRGREKVDSDISIPLKSFSDRSKSRLAPSSSSPSLLTRSYSPRRTATASHSNDYSSGASSYTPRSSYSSSRKETSSSNTGSYTIPISSSRREFLRSLPSSSSSVSKRSNSPLRIAPAPYSSSYLKSSYSSSSPRHGYSSLGRTGLGSKSTPLSKYSTDSGLASSRKSYRY